MGLYGALPARFRRERVLIIGCGDVGVRTTRVLGAGRRIGLLALTSSPSRLDALRSHGVVPLLGDLDDPRSLRRLSGIATRILHLAPPPSEGGADGTRDPRTRHLTWALARRTPPAQLVYGSTTGVYGDCAGAWVAETRPVDPSTPRARRRVDAEQLLRQWGRRHRVGVTLLRIPGIYAADRAGGPRERLLRGTPVLAPADDVYTNHIHADDLARACARALWHKAPQRVFNVSDHTELKMGDYFDLAADLYGLPRPERVARAHAPEHLSPMTLSFMSESRRIDNRRMTAELRLRLRYPTVREGLEQMGR